MRFKTSYPSGAAFEWPASGVARRSSSATQRRKDDLRSPIHPRQRAAARSPRALVRTVLHTPRHGVRVASAWRLELRVRSDNPEVGIREVASGEACARTQGRTIDNLPRERVPEPTSSIPTEDELRVIQMMSKGLTDRTIARRLGVSVITVRRRADRFRAKVKANSRIQAVAIAARRGWIEPERSVRSPDEQ